jgi:hypothetical protein
VLPANTIILLVKTDYIGVDLWFAIGTNDDRIKVFDYAETVAT